jgi:release factor glutamine methyltransferase
VIGKAEASAFVVHAEETIGALAARLAAALRACGIEEAHEDARALICAAGPISRLDLLVRPDQPVDPTSAGRIEGYARRRLCREPVSRILGSRGFWSFDLTVSENVLDPRNDTECLVETCVALMSAKREARLRVLDVGTGSGAILAAVLTEFRQAIGVGIDLSSDAARCARDNLDRLGLADRSIVLEQDWSEPLPEKFDVVLSNPPYVETDVITTLDPEVRNHDPELALDGGVDGLDAYRSITRHASDWLKPAGLLIFEIGYTQASSVRALLRAQGFNEIGCRQDRGGQDRVIHGRFNG